MSSSRTRARRRAPALLAAFAAVLFALVAGVALRPAPAAALSIFPVCIEMGGQAGPEIAGPMVVWTDNRNGNLDIYGRKLGSQSDFSICTNKSQQDNPSVTAYALMGAKVHYIAVWVDKRNHEGGDASDIYGRDITAKEDFVVAKSATVKWFPEIVDHWVAWVEADDPAGPYRVKARDLDSGVTHLIAATNTLSPIGLTSRVDAGKTVYTVVYTSGKGNISGRNLPAGDPFNVTQRNTFEWWPDISGNRVTWWEAGDRIWMRDLGTGRRKFLDFGARPRIDGTRVVWDGGGHGGEFTTTYDKGARIYVRNVARGTAVTEIRQKNQTCLFPAVSGKTVVWEAGPARRILGHIHIYGAHLR